jgi:hypothetical protein
LKTLIKEAENNDDSLSMARHGDTLLKSLKALRDQEEYEKRTLRRDQCMQVAKLMGDHLADAFLNRVDDRELARDIVNTAIESFQADLVKSGLI